MRGLLDLTWGHMNEECSEPRSNNSNLLLLNTINKIYMKDIYFSPSLGGYFRNNILLIWSLKIMSSSMFSKVTWHAGSTKTHFLSLVILPSVYVTQLNVFKVAPVIFLIFTFLPVNSCQAILRRHLPGDMKRTNSGRYRGSATRTTSFLFVRRKNISSPSGSTLKLTPVQHYWTNKMFP